MSAPARQRVRVGLELTGLELSGTGTSRAIKGLQAALAGHDRVEVEPFRRSGRFRRSAKTKNLDVLHCAIRPAPIRSPCPLVVTVNDVRPWLRPGDLEHALEDAAAILTPSHFTRNEILALLDIDPGRVVVAPYGVPDGFEPGPRPVELLEELGVFNPYVLTVGATPRKNLSTTVAAFERAMASGRPHRLVIVGDPEEDPHLLSIIAASNAAARIHLIANVGDATMLGLYQGADCLVDASGYEGFAFPLLEAMACGVPVIASNRTATAEVAGDAGMLVDPDDAYAFGAALEQLLDSPKLHTDYSARGVARAAEYSWDTCAELVASVYEHAAERDEAPVLRAA
jgi:glycosyltransferase involved in cell wall biosynthesis